MPMGEKHSHARQHVPRCWSWYQTGVHQVWMLIHRSLCTLNIHQCTNCTAELLSHQHRCPTLSFILSCRITASLHLFRFSSFTVAPIGSKNISVPMRTSGGDFSISYSQLIPKKSLHSSLYSITSLSVSFFFVFGSTALLNSFAAQNQASILL